MPGRLDYSFLLPVYPRAFPLQSFHILHLGAISDADAEAIQLTEPASRQASKQPKLKPSMSNKQTQVTSLFVQCVGG